MGPRSIRVAVVVAVGAVLATACAAPGRTNPDVVTDPPPGATGPSAGCGATTQGPVADEARTIAVDGVGVRRFSLTVPPVHTAGTSAPVPLVLDFHGLLEGWAGTHPFATRFSELAGAEGFAVAYPIGSGDGVYWDVSLDEANPDLRFVDALVAELGSTMCIDRSRVYVTGLSYGAFMTSMLMCMRANTFAAAAPVAGIRNACTATERRIPVVTFHGTADPILPYPSFADTPQDIATKYRCDEPTATTMQPDPDPATGGPIVRTSWDCGGVPAAVESYRIEGGGHSWPGSTFFSWIGFIVGPTASSLDATGVIWDFFSRHHL